MEEVQQGQAKHICTVVRVMFIVSSPKRRSQVYNRLFRSSLLVACRKDGEEAFHSNMLVALD